MGHLREEIGNQESSRRELGRSEDRLIQCRHLPESRKPTVITITKKRMRPENINLDLIEALDAQNEGLVHFANRSTKIRICAEMIKFELNGIGEEDRSCDSGSQTRSE